MHVNYCLVLNAFQNLNFYRFDHLFLPTGWYLYSSKNLESSKSHPIDEMGLSLLLFFLIYNLWTLCPTHSCSMIHIQWLENGSCFLLIYMNSFLPRPNHGYLVNAARKFPGLETTASSSGMEVRIIFVLRERWSRYPSIVHNHMHIMTSFPSSTQLRQEKERLTSILRTALYYRVLRR